MKEKTKRGPTPNERLYQHVFRVRWKWREEPGFRVPVVITPVPPRTLLASRVVRSE